MAAIGFRHGLAIALGLLAAAAAGAQAPRQEAAAKPKTDATAHHISGPYTHEKLAIFLIHGADRIKNKDFLKACERATAREDTVKARQNLAIAAFKSI